MLHPAGLKTLGRKKAKFGVYCSSEYRNRDWLAEEDKVMTLIKGYAGVRGTFGSDISVGMVVRDGCAQHRLEGRLLILAKKHSRRPVWLVVTLFVV